MDATTSQDAKSRGHEPVDARDRLVALLRTIREEQVSKAMFGGQHGERAEKSRIYASAIKAAANQIDDVLAEIEIEAGPQTGPSVMGAVARALIGFCDPAKLRTAVMMSGAHLSQQQACDIIDEDRLGIRVSLLLLQGQRDPVHQDDTAWWFWDETWADRLGPYPDEWHARGHLSAYLHRLTYGDLGMTVS